MYRKLCYQCVFAIAAAVLIAPARAQNIRSVRFYTVKPDRVADYLAASKEYVAVLTKGGSDRSFSMWHSLSGANQYALIFPANTKWANLDAGPDPKMKGQAAAELQSVDTRIIQCVESSRRVIEAKCCRI